MRNRIVIAITALVAAAGAALSGGCFRPTSAAPGALGGGQAVEDFKAGFGLSASTASLVASLQSALAANPKDEHSWVLLGLGYEQRSRETGDPSYYTKADGALHR